MVNKKGNGSTTADGKITCGLVMPISQTANHDQVHWSRVQQLLHRVVRQAGFLPLNVWEGSAVDRITPRILKNLFNTQVIICDISDLNPNVMLELGMRLTSKKPTIVIAETGSTIPFDIKDFETIFYPKDLNMLDMEEFFLEIIDALNGKNSAFVNGEYEPFLRDVDIDFLDTEGRGVPFETLVEKRLDSITERLERISATNAAVTSFSVSPTPITSALMTKRARAGALVKFDVTAVSGDQVVAAILEHAGLYGNLIGAGEVIVGFGKIASPSIILQLSSALNKAGITAEVMRTEAD